MEVLLEAWNSVDGFIAGLLAVLGFFSILAKLTPTDKDDKLWAKLINFVGLAKNIKKN